MKIKVHILPALEAFLIVMGIVLLLWITISPVSSLNLTLADSTVIGNHSVLVINGDGALLAEGYSTSTFDLNISDAANSTILIHIKPENTNYLEDPNAFLDQVVYQVQHNLLAISILLVGAVIILGRK